MDRTPRYERMIFLDEAKRKEWEDLDPSVRRGVFNHLHSTANEMEMRTCIDLLCNVIIDLEKRVEELENKELRRNAD